MPKPVTKRVETRTKEMRSSFLIPEGTPSRLRIVAGFLKRVDTFSSELPKWNLRINSLADIPRARHEIQKKRDTIYAFGQEGAKIYSGFEPVSGAASRKLDLNSIEMRELALHKCLRFLDHLEMELKTKEHSLRALGRK